MAEIKLRTPVYKVTMTEYERGWGQRPMGEKYFDNEQDAKAFCEQWSDYTDPDCYYRASYTRIA
jgi:hypothetical protein